MIRGVIRFMVVGGLLLAPPLGLLWVSGLVVPRSFTLPNREWSHNWSHIQQGDIRSDDIVTGLVIVISICWLRIAVGFVVDCLRILRHHPLHHVHRWSAKLACWALMLSPSVLIAGPPAQLRATTVRLQTTEREFRADSLPTPHVLVSALVVSGLLIRIRARRRRILRQGGPLPVPTLLAWESHLERVDDQLAIVRVELAIRSLLSIGAASFRFLLRGTDGSILVEFEQERTPRHPWRYHAPRIWTLCSEIPLDDLAEVGGSWTGLLPVMFPVGTTGAGEVWVNLQQIGAFAVHGTGDSADSVWRSICQTLSLSPFCEHVHLISVEDEGLRGRRDVVIPERERACLLAERLNSSETPALLLSQYRVHQASVVGLLHRERPEREEFGVVLLAGTWYLQPFGVAIQPHLCSVQDLAIIDVLVPPSRIERVSERVGELLDIDSTPEFLDPYRFVASVLGVPHVRHVSGQAVHFERQRSEELVIWLALHPDCQRRSLARADMWSVAIKDATFSNITSDVRRSLTTVEMPLAGEEWLGITLTDDLPLHPLIVSDAWLLGRCYEQARLRPEQDGMKALEFGLNMVSSVPFCGSNYLWKDASGLGSEFALLVVRAALLLSNMYVDSRHDDQISPSRKPAESCVEGVYWATSKGLQALPGHEDLVIRRMELHSQLGDRAALCAEWQAYCRALVADDWGDVEPSTKMIQVWRRLSQAV